MESLLLPSPPVQILSLAFFNPSVRHFAVVVQQAFFSAQHFAPALQQAGFALAEQQADSPSQQASLAVQQSATCAPVFAAAFFAQQQEQVFAAASTTEALALPF